MSHETRGNANEQRSEYTDRLQAILETPLTPETINTYADDALDEVVRLVDAYTNDYLNQPTLRSHTMAENERNASHYWRLRDVDEVLDHLIEKSDEIRALDVLIGSIALHSRVIVPPELSGGSVRAGAGNFEPKRIFERLKTTLFILQAGFDIDVHDRSQVSILEGIVTDSMMREHSYYAVDVPPLERTMLICDEEGNRTYVFDSKQLAEISVSNEQLLALTKSELKTLLQNNPQAGQWLRHSSRFAERIYESLIDAGASQNQTEDEAMPNFLDPAEVAESKTTEELATEFNVAASTIRREIKPILDEIGYPTIIRRKKGQPQKLWRPDQVVTIQAFLEGQGLLVERAPEGVACFSNLRDKYGGRKDKLRKIIESIDELGEVKRYHFERSRSEGYDQRQQRLIDERMMEIYPPAPEFYLPARSIGAQFNADKGTVYRAIGTLGTRLGDVVNAWATSTVTPHYSPWQQNMIFDTLEAQGEFLEPAPEGYASKSQLCELTGYQSETVQGAIDELDDKLGEVRRYKFYAKRVPGYSPEAQAMIIEHLKQKSLGR